MYIRYDIIRYIDFIISSIIVGDIAMTLILLSGYGIKVNWRS